MRARPVPLIATASLVAASLVVASNPVAAADDAEGTTIATISAPDDVELMRYPPSSVRFGLVSGGLVALGIPYGIGALCASAWEDGPGSEWLYAPVIGPWVAFVKNDCAPDDSGCGAILVMRGILYVVSGLAQAGGAGLIGEGLLMTTEADQPAPEVSWTLLPTASPQQTGLSVVGTF